MQKASETINLLQTNCKQCISLYCKIDGCGHRPGIDLIGYVQWNGKLIQLLIKFKLNWIELNLISNKSVFYVIIYIKIIHQSPSNRIE